MIVEIKDQVSIIDYNKVAIHPLQSWEWGEARKKMGIKVIRIGEFSKDQITNVYQITFHPIPYTQYVIGYMPRAWIPSKHVIQYLVDYGKKYNVIFFKIEPNVTRKNHTTSILNNNQLIKSPHPLFPEWTQILNLMHTEEELLKKMHQKTRYNIKLAQKKGVVVKEMSNSQGFEIFSKLYFNTCKRQHYFGHTPLYHKIIWDMLQKNIAHILIAFYDQIPLAAYELFHFNNVLYYPYGGTSVEHRNLMGANLLMWEAILLGKKLDVQHFDMWGSLSHNYKTNHPWSGFTRFKEGYGTEYVQMIGSFDLVVNKSLYSIYNSFYKLREIFLSIKKRV